MKIIKSIIFILFMTIAISCNFSNDSDSKNDSQDSVSEDSLKEQHVSSENTLTDGVDPLHLEVFQPLSQTYFDDFFNSQIEISQFRFWYFVRDDISLRVNSIFEMDLSGDWIISSNYSQISEYHAYTSDSNLKTESAWYEMPSVHFTPIMTLISTQPVYFFNAAEYNGEPEIIKPTERYFGHECFISLTIIPPQVDLFKYPPGKAFVKGWNPGENPPVELLPLIGYLENVLIPQIKEHGE